MSRKDPLSDFRNFLFMVWDHLQLPTPTPVQYDLAVYLQHGPKRCVIEAFRGVGKSWVTSAYVCWLLLRDPQHKVLVVSASKSRADDFTTFTMRLILEMPVLQHLRPRTDQRNSKIAFDVGPARPDHSPSVKSVGITGQLAGSRADTIIADDVEVPNNSFTLAMRDKLSESVKEFDAILKPGGRIVYLGTPQTEQSIYNTLPERGYEVRIWPVRYPDDKQIGGYGPRLAPFILDKIARGAKEGTSTEPRRFSDEDLREREASYGRAGFALQFMLDTRLSDADRYPLKIADLIVMSCNPEVGPAKIVWAGDPGLIVPDLPNVAFTGDRFYRPMWTADQWTPYTGSVMAIDPSGRGRDETAYAVVKFLHGFLYVTACGGFSGGYSDETLEGLAKIAKEHAVNQIIVEANFGDGMFTKLLQPVMTRTYPCSIEEVKHSTQKERRIIDTLEPVMMQHKLVIDPRVIKADYDSVMRYPAETQRNYMLMHQLTRITRDRGALAQDDRLDALSIAVAYWVENMSRDADKAQVQLIEKLRDKEYKKFVAGFYRSRGMAQPKTGWIRV